MLGCRYWADPAPKGGGPNEEFFDVAQPGAVNDPDEIYVGQNPPSLTPQEEMNGTAELNVTYTRPAVGTAMVEEHEVGRASSMRVMEFSVSDADGAFAFGRSTYAVRMRSAQ